MPSANNRLISRCLLNALVMLFAMTSHSALGQGWPAYAPYPQYYYPAQGRMMPRPTPYPQPATYPRLVPPFGYGYGHAYPYPAPALPQRQLQQAPSDPVPAQPSTSLRQDGLSVSERKKQFVDRLLPAIQRENRRLMAERERMRALLQRVANGRSIGSEQQAWLVQIARRYRVEDSPLTHAEARRKLIRRLDIIPASLALAQAANESGWGRSRFSTEANNLFGIWTYDASQGLTPQARDEDKKHFVRKFERLEDSLVYYMRMLNSHPAYARLREIRSNLRNSGQRIDGHRLAEGLNKYSERGAQYVGLIRELIEQNDWSLLDRSGTS